MTFFKMFERTRYLSTISFKVLIDLIPFLVVLIGQNVVFAVIFKALEFVGEKFVDDRCDEGDDATCNLGCPKDDPTCNSKYGYGEGHYADFDSFTRSFSHVWDLMLGDYDYRFNTELGIILYYICTVFVQIAMLNIVISVVSDTYDRV